MVQNTDHNTEHELDLNNVINPYLAQYHRDRCYPALIFRQGNRKMIQINVLAHDLPTLLQAKHSIDNNPDSGKNRPEVPGHVHEIKDYIRERVTRNRSWVLGTITANVDPSKIKVILLGHGMGLAVIPRNVKLDITDGQHRIRAIDELVTGSETESSLIGDDDFPITLILEPDFKQCQTDFRDMAQTRQLHKSLLLSFGEFEGRIGITKSIIESVPMFSNKTENIKASPATNKKLIYTINYLVKFVSCAFTDDANKELRGYDVERSSNSLIACCNNFFSNCRNTREIFEKDIRDLTTEDVGKFKENCVLGRSVGLEVLGRLLHYTYDRENNIFDENNVLKLSQLDWSTGSSLWNGSIVKVDPNPKNPTKPYKISASMNLVKIAVNEVKEQLGWLDRTPLF
ncbi:DNA sulfur modification protein DndB [Roseofilum reptotaenium CS-1145]|uniref:DGQHR domain-containing protein n=1 Tax=Roseofilum reptotaenium AO1-A TaxID=1925591 RepID=A0A1L9QR00_9CYAN|nr:DNA sulfur modification protein DndB [Roseofilum reptotaenium]MDB9516065.1 DNA sulfur modification protein DndB [Roseofilum reptotaenium CS-1145]OJJ25017.1 hypothetical protein BI308_13325 [Roseofilum reptotaenium AO1-A]